MPYIKKVERKAIDNVKIGDFCPGEEGQLNYAISRIINNLLEEDISYKRINSIIGVLECAKLELYRVVASRYEDRKRMENGDVYDNFEPVPNRGTVPMRKVDE